MDTLRTEAWLLRGISSIPGELELREGRVRFTALNAGSAWPWQWRRLEADLGRPGLARTVEQEGQRAVLFDWPVGEVRYHTPWYHFGGGLRLECADLSLNFGLGEPTDGPGNRFDPVGEVQRAAREFRSVGLMRQRGRLWRAALAAAGAQTDRG